MNNEQKSDKLLTQLIKNKAGELGFSACGICKTEKLEEYEGYLKSSIDSGFHGEKEYLVYNLEKRLNPQTIIPNAKSVIVLLINYYTGEKQDEKSFYKISRYAYGKDYHDVINEKQTILEQYIKTLLPDSQTASFVDSAKMLDRALAKKSGLGWIGKNCLLVNKEFGTFCFIGEIVIDKEFVYDKPSDNDLCGTCTRCIDACPTKALTGPNRLNAPKCIPYNTIERRNEFPDDMKVKLHQWIYGCDICQDVCPHNKDLKPTAESAFFANPELLAMTKEDWENLTEEKFNQLFSESAVRRTKYEGLIRNIRANHL
jgi:epoxyqueuosine reductase